MIFIELDLDTIVADSSRATYGVVPVLVGSISKDVEGQYGAIFAKYLDDPTNFFIISSDFCHWGKRFSFMYYEPSDGPIYKSIEALDRQGMQAIESQDIDKWYSYLKQYKNTICGRHPIGVFLNVSLEYVTKVTCVIGYKAEPKQTYHQICALCSI
jgi:AmmeMemoRadiSam system protein B